MSYIVFIGENITYPKRVYVIWMDFIRGRETITPYIFLYVNNLDISEEENPKLKMEYSYLNDEGEKIKVEILDCKYFAFVEKDGRGNVESIFLDDKPFYN